MFTMWVLEQGLASYLIKKITAIPLTQELLLVDKEVIVARKIVSLLVTRLDVVLTTGTRMFQPLGTSW